MEAPKEDGWVQDNDVLDTWFSSALWPFATLGWPNDTKLLEKYYPNQCLVTGYDIIPFWVNRMTFQGEKLLGQRPFEDCLIHGLIRDKLGRKFSKSLGNGINPFDMVEAYGADALRYYLATDVSSGTDMRFDEEKIKSTWNYINKIWNIKTVTKHMEKYDFNIVGSELYNFIYDDFCSNYIEMAKFSLNDETTKSVLTYVLTGILKMLHPFMPFVTEEIYQKLPIKDSESIMISTYPSYNKNEVFEDIEIEIDDEILFIKNFRNVKKENNISKDMKIKFIGNNPDELLIKILKLEDQLIDEELAINSYNVISNNIKAVIYFEKEESEEDKALKQKEIESLESSIARRKALLSNENYVNKAPAALVEKERETLKQEEEKLTILKNS